MPENLVFNFLIILGAGLLAGIVSKRLNIPMVIGYLVAGALIGPAGLKLFIREAAEEASRPAAVRVEETDSAPAESAASEEKAAPSSAEAAMVSQNEILDKLADLGALFLLFTIGIHFTPSDIVKNKKFLFLGGPVQMILVIAPLTFVVYKLNGDWRTGMLIGFAASLSSTVLVFKSLAEFGQSSSPYGKRAVSILLFQDIATAPILLVIPLLFPIGGETVSIANTFILMGGKALFFVVLIAGIRLLFTTKGISMISQLKSVEIMVLFTVFLLFGVCAVADRLMLPEAIGAFATGVALSENRLTSQIGALVTPFRETFSAIFFVTLGALFDPQVLIDFPVPTLAILLGLLLLKLIAGAVAFKVIGLSVVPSLAMGLGISQLGELSFIILQQGPFRAEHPQLYQQILFAALTSIILTPCFLRLAMNVVKKRPIVENVPADEPESLLPEDDAKHCGIVVGLGPIGKQVTQFLARSGVELTLIDTNPGNFQDLAQLGFQTIAGDASEARTLKLAGVDRAHLIVITIPNDVFATDTIRSIRRLREDCTIVARCRYKTFVAELERAGADLVVCEEDEAGQRLIERMGALL